MTAPSNNNWRIAGAVGIDPDPTQSYDQETMLQGLGFPLRPVSSVPPTTSQPIPDTLVAIGQPMQFMENGYEAGKYYPEGGVVSNGTWAMVAKILTLEYPFPEPEGDPTFGIPTFTPTTQFNESVVYSGHNYTFTSPVFLKTLRVLVTQLTVDTNYRVVAIITLPGNTPITTVFESPILTENAWRNIAAFNKLLPAGTTMQLYVDALNSGADNQVTGGWNFTGQDNVNAPQLQGWNHDNANTVVRIDKTDLDGTDRSTELSGITVDSNLQFSDTNNPSAFNQYRVTGTPTDAGTYWSYPVVLQEQGEGGVPIGVTTFTATIPIPQPTEYAEEVGVPTPVWATVEGYLAFDGVEQVAGQTNTYGVDIECDVSTVPIDWNVLSYNSLT